MKIHNITTYNKLEYFKFQNKICINYKKTFLLEKKGEYFVYHHGRKIRHHDNKREKY